MICLKRFLNPFGKIILWLFIFSYVFDDLINYFCSEILKQCTTYSNTNAISPIELSKVMKLVSRSWLLWLHCLSPLCSSTGLTVHKPSSKVIPKDNAGSTSAKPTKQLVEEYESFKARQFSNAATVSSSSGAKPLTNLPRPYLVSNSTELQNKVYFFELITPAQGVGKCSFIH